MCVTQMKTLWICYRSFIKTSSTHENACGMMIMWWCWFHCCNPKQTRWNGCSAVYTSELIISKCVTQMKTLWMCYRSFIKTSSTHENACGMMIMWWWWSHGCNPKQTRNNSCSAVYTSELITSICVLHK